MAHKTGSITGVHHDSGIVYLPDGRVYVLVILSKNLEEFEDATGYGWESGLHKHDWKTLINNKNKEITRLNGIYQKLLEIMYWFKSDVFQWFVLLYYIDDPSFFGT